MSKVVEGAEQKTGFLSRLEDVWEFLKSAGKVVGVLAIFIGIVSVGATLSTANHLKNPAYCYVEENMVGDYLIAGIKSDNSMVVYKPSDPSAYYLLTLSTESWDSKSIWGQVGAVWCGGVAKDFIAIESVESLSVSATPVEIVEIQEAK